MFVQEVGYQLSPTCRPMHITCRWMPSASTSTSSCTTWSPNLLATSTRGVQICLEQLHWPTMLPSIQLLGTAHTRILLICSHLPSICYCDSTITRAGWDLEWKRAPVRDSQAHGCHCCDPPADVVCADEASPSNFVEIAHWATTSSASRYGSGFARLCCSRHCGTRSVWVWLLPLQLLLSPAMLGHMPMPVILETPPALFDQPAGFSLPSDNPAVNLGRPPSELAMSDDLRFEPR